MSSSTNKPEQKYQSVHAGSLAEEFAKNDDIVDYIQDTSLEKLKAKYGAVEEDSKIRKNYGSVNIRPSAPSPVHNKEPKRDVLDIQTLKNPKSKFATTTSRYDNDSILFGDIKLEENNVEKEPVAEEPPKKKRGRPPKVKTEEPQAPTTPKRRGRPPKNPVVEQPETTITEKFNTNTKVIFVNEEIEDGIKRTDEIEVSSAFIKEKPKKRKGLFRR